MNMFKFNVISFSEFTIWIIGQLVKILSHKGFSPLHSNSMHSQTCLLEVLSCQNTYIYDCAINDYSKFITSNYCYNLNFFLYNILVICF